MVYYFLEIPGFGHDRATIVAGAGWCDRFVAAVVVASG
jgi:hypothetical protein